MKTRTVKRRTSTSSRRSHLALRNPRLQGTRRLKKALRMKIAVSMTMITVRERRAFRSKLVMPSLSGFGRVR